MFSGVKAVALGVRGLSRWQLRYETFQQKSKQVLHTACVLKSNFVAVSAFPFAVLEL